MRSFDGVFFRQLIKYEIEFLDSKIGKRIVLGKLNLAYSTKNDNIYKIVNADMLQREIDEILKIQDY
jgi:uncharacterized protein YehS (DUF1456 family)